MNTMQPRAVAVRWGVGCLSVWLAITCAQANFIPQLYVGNVAPVRDQYNRLMRGAVSPEGEADRWRIEIRVAPEPGVRMPPNLDGSAHPANPLVTPESVGGIGLNAGEDHSGLFCMAFPERLPAGTKIFARAFNAPTLEEASFYADSSVVAVSGNASTIELTFGPAQEIDSSIDPATGLSLSWLKFLDGDPDRDLDGDGMSDYDEWLVGTDPDDPDSNLSFRLVRRETGAAVPSGSGLDGENLVRVRWQSVPGKRYQLQFVPTLLGELEFINVGEVVTAGDGEYEIDMLVDVSADSVAGVFRLKLVHDGD